MFLMRALDVLKKPLRIAALMHRQELLLGLLGLLPVLSLVEGLLTEGGELRA